MNFHLKIKYIISLSDKDHRARKHDLHNFLKFQTLSLQLQLIHIMNLFYNMKTFNSKFDPLIHPTKLLPVPLLFNMQKGAIIIIFFCRLGII